MKAGPPVAACPVCRGHCAAAFVTGDLNRRVSDTPFEYDRCLACGLIFLREPPADLGRYYPPGYVSVPPSLERLKHIAAQTRYQIDMVRAVVPAGRLLEIGPGFGSFAWLARTSGFSVDVIESDAEACAYLRNAIGVNVTESAEPHAVLAACAETYDAIVLWHSIEHLPDPWTTLEQAARILSPGGVLLVATPNPGSWQFGIMRARWPHIDAPRHLWLMPLPMLERFLSAHQLTLVNATSDDPAGRSWNRFGWSQRLRNAMPFDLGGWLVVRGASRVLGRLVAFLTAPFEHAPLRGSAYTAIFRRAPPEASVKSGTLNGG